MKTIISFVMAVLSTFLMAFGQSVTPVKVLKGQNPLVLFHFGDKPTQALTENEGNRIVQYAIQDFLGIQRMTLGYTKKGTLFSICFISENDHYSAAESDARVSKLMQLCDEWCAGIEWDIGEQEHDGRKFAIGRIKSTCRVIPQENGMESTEYNFQDMVFSIIPTRGERNVVGLQVNLIDNRRRRLETDYLTLDVRHPLQISEAQYNNAKEWLRKQLDDHALGECQSSRKYDKDRLYEYHYSFERHLVDDHRRGWISLESGVLEIDGEIPIDESYAEQLIRAKIIVMNKVFSGIAGEIYDDRPLGPGASIKLPCPLCHGNKSKSDACRECWNKTRKRNSGLISLRESEFREKFNAYKEYYRARVAPSGWHDKPKANSKPNKPKSPPLHKEYKPKAKEQRDIDHALRSGRESSRKFNKQRLH